MAEHEISRPVLRYHGGKFRLAKWVIGHFPEHSAYVEPFGGAASVLMQKDRSKHEVYNDLDEHIVNVFRVLRNVDLSARLLDLLRLTPYSRVEFEEAYMPTDDLVEMARRTIIRSFMGQGSNAATRSTRNGFRSKRVGSLPPVSDWTNYPEHLSVFTERLRGVTIECRPAVNVLQRYDHVGTLFFIDPPYLPEVRTCNHKSYRYEMTVSQHEDLLRAVLGLSGMRVVAGYDSELYCDMLAGWKLVKSQSRADRSAIRTECLWLSPNIMPAQGSLLAAM